jgi:hypothetical protein
MSTASSSGIFEELDDVQRMLGKGITKSVNMEERSARIYAAVLGLKTGKSLKHALHGKMRMSDAKSIAKLRMKNIICANGIVKLNVDIDNMV